MGDTPEKNGSDNDSTSNTTSTHTLAETGVNSAREGLNETVTDDSISKFTPTDLVAQPEVALENVQDSEIDETPTCIGRGKETAAVRGYNAERLAYAVFQSKSYFFSISAKSWYDTLVLPRDDIKLRIESKSCVDRYPSGPYGRFRVWRRHHSIITGREEYFPEDYLYLYFFVVYTITPDGVEEVGKLVAHPAQIDEVLDKWTVRDHPTMGDQKARDISWNLLLKRLGVPKPVFRELPIVDLTDGFPSTSSADK